MISVQLLLRLASFILVTLIAWCSVVVVFSVDVSTYIRLISMYSSSSYDVINGTISILLVMLAIILIMCFFSAFVRLHAFRLYVIIVSTQLLIISHIAFNPIPLKYLFLAIASIVW